MSPEFLLTSLIVVASPGTGAIYTIAAGLTRGSRASVLAAFACTLGIVPHLLAAMLGLAALLHASALAFAVVKYAGVAYLLFMGWQTLQEHGALSVEAKADPRSAWRVLRDGVAINVLNPKLSIFFVAFLPQFINAAAPDAFGKMIKASLVFMALTFVVFAIYGLCAASIRQHVIGRPEIATWIKRVFGFGFLAMAAKLAAAQR